LHNTVYFLFACIIPKDKADNENRTQVKAEVEVLRKTIHLLIIARRVVIFEEMRDITPHRRGFQFDQDEV